MFFSKKMGVYSDVNIHCVTEEDGRRVSYILKPQLKREGGGGKRTIDNRKQARW